jgi:hypothetical protein
MLRGRMISQATKTTRKEPLMSTLTPKLSKVNSDNRVNADQSSDEDDEERTSDVNVNAQTEQGQQRQPRERPHRVTVPTWKVKQNQLNAEEITESPTTVDLIMLNLTNATEQLQAPQSISEILKRKDKNLWLESMHRELRALLRNKTWEYIRRSDIPQGHKILTGRWIWVYKRDGTRKSRWVVRGFEQVEGIDYQETFAAEG